MWSQAQTEIFNHLASDSRNLVVRARAGTGKTTTIIAGLEHVRGGKTLLCAFNKKIAVELDGRIGNLTNLGTSVQALTLHSLGFKFVRYNWQGVTIDKFRSDRLARGITGPRVSDEVIAMVCKLSSLAKGISPFAERDHLENIAYNHNVLDASALEEGSGVSEEDIYAWTLKLLEASCVKDGTIDFDDMIFVPVRNGWVRPWFDLVIVDECQDMNFSQILMAQKACKRSGRIVVVGDDRQAIYSFRGADSQSLDRLKRELNAVELPLTTTYRCPKVVVAAAAEIVSDYMAAENAPEGTMEAVDFRNVAEEVQEGDAVLSRLNAPLMGLCLRIMRQGKRARVEGRDIGAGLVKIVDKLGKKNSIPDFLEKLKGWEKKQVDRIKAARKGEKDAVIAARCEAVFDQTECLRVLAADMESIKMLKERILSLFEDATEGTKRETVILSSVHKAKGLEWNNVYGLMETLRNGDIEEQNIRYVMLTRAKNCFYEVFGMRQS